MIINIILIIIITILLFILLFKEHKYIQIDKETIEKNKKIQEESEKRQLFLKTMEEKQALADSTLGETQKRINEATKIIGNMNAAAHEAFDQYCESLDQEYQNAEQEHDDAIDALRHSYDTLQDILMLKIKKTQEELDKISSTRAAALEAQLKEQEIKDKLSFYCPQVPEEDLKDAHTLRDIEYKLNNPRILRMLIWQSYYQKPMNQICANVLGAATAEKCGIYKITNQKTDLVYIGQAVDMATR